MKRALLQRTILSPGRQAGPSPAENRYYVLILFDIGNPKKYRILIRILNRYARLIQKSVFEGNLRPREIKRMTDAIEGLMSSSRYYNQEDNVRIYRIAGNCSATVFGTCATMSSASDIFI